MYNLKIFVNGKPIPNYFDRYGKCWVEARKGTKFEIKIMNDWWNRVLAIVSVDGLNIINAKFEPPEISPGYIVNRFSSITIPGWKINENEARDFIFTDREKSYATKVGADQQNVGVIGVAIIDEKVNYRIFSDYIFDKSYNENPIWYWQNPIHITSNTRGFSNPSYSCDCNSYNYDGPNLGVGSGEKEQFVTGRQYFERGNLIKIINVYYDHRNGLINRGIIQEKSLFPKSFPEVNAYCPDL